MSHAQVINFYEPFYTQLDAVMATPEGSFVNDAILSENGQKYVSFAILRKEKMKAEATRKARLKMQHRERLEEASRRAEKLQQLQKAGVLPVPSREMEGMPYSVGGTTRLVHEPSAHGQEMSTSLISLS